MTFTIFSSIRLYTFPARISPFIYIYLKTFTDMSSMRIFLLRDMYILQVTFNSRLQYFTKKKKFSRPCTNIIRLSLYNGLSFNLFMSNSVRKDN